jgi:uncharacterized protein
MKTFTVALTLCLAHLTSFAAPATEASVERLLDAMNARGVVDNSHTQVEKMMRGMALQPMGGRQPSEQQQKSLDATVSKTMALMRDEFTWDKLKPDFVKLYVTTFDQEEIDSLVAFYSSPAGQAFVRKMPIVMQKSMEYSQAQMQRLMPRMMKIIEEAATGK